MSNKINLIFSAEVDRAVKSVKTLRASLTPLSQSQKKVGTSFASSYSKIRKTNNALNNITKDANRSSNSFKALTGTMKGFNQILGAGKMYLVGNALASAVKSSMDMIETTNLFNVAMGQNAIASNEFAENLGKAFGMDLTNVHSAIGTFSLLSRSMGMSSSNSKVLSENTAKLAYDLASLTNVPINQVMGDLRSGLVGQSETMYKYGVDVTEAALKQEILNQGITKSVRNMSQGEKMALRYSAIIRQTSLSHGDFAKTILTPANQLRILQEQFVTLSRAIGSVFIPMLSAVLPYLNAIVSIAITAVKAIALLFGYEAPKIENTGGLNNVVDDADSASDAVGGTTKAIKGTTKALKQLKSMTAGMDELNLLTPPPDSSSDAGGGAGAGGVGIGGGLADFDLGGYDNFMDKVKAVSDELIKKVEPVLKRILFIGGLIGLALLSWKLANFLSDLTVSSRLLSDLRGLFGMTKEFGLIKSLQKIFPILTMATGIFLIIGGGILIFKDFKAIIDESKPSIDEFIKALRGVALFAGGIALIFGAVAGGIALALGVIVLTAIAIYKYWDEIKAKTSDIWAKVKVFVTTSITGIKTFVTDEIPKIIKSIVAWWAELPYKIGYAIGFVIGTLVKWILNVANWIKIELPKVIASIALWFAGLPERIKIALSSTSTKIYEWGVKTKADFKVKVDEIVLAVKTWFSGMPQKIFDAIKNFSFSNIGRWMLDGIFAGFSNMGTRITKFVKGFTDGFKSALGISSPSKVMEDKVGIFLGLGIMKGLESTTKGIVSVAETIADGITKPFTNLELTPSIDYTTGGLILPNINGEGTISVTARGHVNDSYNMPTTSQSNNNSDALLRELIQTVSGLDLSISEDDIGKSAIKSINKTNRIYGKNVVRV